MENASKALIIAGAVLLALLIVSLAVYIFNNFGTTAKKMANLDEETISAFNSKITPYLGESVAGSQVNALLQYCLTNNMKAKQDTETYKYIIVYVDGAADPYIDGDSETYQKLATNGVYYKVEGEYDDDYGLLTTIYITKN